MNVQSPVFVPNSSCSSSTGGEISVGGSSNTASNGNLLASSLELNTPLAGGNAWPILSQTTPNVDMETPPKISAGKKTVSLTKAKVKEE